MYDGIDFNAATTLCNGKSRIEIQTTKIIRHGKKVRIILDIAEELVREIDQIRDRIGGDRAALFKIRLHERVRQEKATGLKR